MKKIWNYIDEKNMPARSKYQLAGVILGSLFSFTGMMIWLIIRNFFLSSPKWLFCFIGYPLVISLLIVFFYGCRHEFHEGAL